MPKYEIIEANENKLDSVIEKSGVTIKFTAQQIIDHLDYTKKALKESEAQLDVNGKQDIMSIEILPILKEIPEDKWQLVMSYAGRQVSRPEIESLIETCKTTIESYESQLAEIKKLLEIEDGE